jgi:hypothetical protein
MSQIMFTFFPGKRGRLDGFTVRFPAPSKDGIAAGRLDGRHNLRGCGCRMSGFIMLRILSVHHTGAFYCDELIFQVGIHSDDA